MINVINFWGSDIFSEWFAPFGAKPNYLTPYSTLESLKHSGEAAATIQACSTLGSYLGAALEQEFGVPELPAAPPYGIAQTDRWFRGPGARCWARRTWQSRSRPEKGRISAQNRRLAGKTPGKECLCNGGAAHGHALLDILGELGMKATGAAIFHHDAVYDSERPENDQLAQRVQDYGNVKNFNVCNKQEFELVNALHKLQPDVLLARHGGMTLWGAKFGIPSLLIGDEHYGMGYEGIVHYGERILETMENDEFVKNLAKHAVNPYTKWWLDQETHYFLQGGADK